MSLGLGAPPQKPWSKPRLKSMVNFLGAPGFGRHIGILLLLLNCLNFSQPIHHHDEYENKKGNHLLSKSGKSSLPFRHRLGDKDGLRVLMVSVDNRELNHDVDAENHISMAAVINHDYAIYHGYDYLIVNLNSTNLRKAILEENRYTPWVYPDGSGSKDWSDSKYGPSVFHTGYNYSRASSWGKLPPMVYLANEYGQYYDYLWYIDSDLVMNPVFRNRSLSGALKEWKTGQAFNNKPFVQWGNPDPTNASMLYLTNFPWRDDFPCAGTFIFKPGTGAALVREWWDYDLAHKNVFDFMEQDALWYLIEAGDGMDFQLNTKSAAMIYEPQFPSKYHGVSELKFAHMANYDANRVIYFRLMLHHIKMEASEPFRVAINHVKRHCLLSLDMLAVSEELESTRPRPVRSTWPKEHIGRNDAEWHDAVYSKILPPKIRAPFEVPLGRIYNGHTIKFKGEQTIFLILNDTSHVFPSWKTFCDMGYTLGVCVW